MTQLQRDPVGAQSRGYPLTANVTSDGHMSGVSGLSITDRVTPVSVSKKEDTSD